MLNSCQFMYKKPTPAFLITRIPAANPDFPMTIFPFLILAADLDILMTVFLLPDPCYMTRTTELLTSPILPATGLTSNPCWDTANSTVVKPCQDCTYIYTANHWCS